MANDTLRVRITADDTQFKKAMTGVQSKVSQAQPHIEKTATAVSGLGSALGGTGSKAGQAIGALSNVAQLLMVSGPIGAAIAGATILISKMTEEWERAKKEAEEFEKAARNVWESQIKSISDQTAELNKRVAAIGKDAWQIAGAEQTRNLWKAEAQVADLESRIANIKKEEWAAGKALGMERSRNPKSSELDDMQKSIDLLRNQRIPLEAELAKWQDARKDASGNIYRLAQLEAEEINARLKKEAEARARARDRERQAAMKDAIAKIEESDKLKQDKVDAYNKWLRDTEQHFRDTQLAEEQVYQEQMDEIKKDIHERELRRVEELALKEQQEDEKRARRLQEHREKFAQGTADFLLGAAQQASGFLNEYISLQGQIDEARRTGNADLLADLRKQEGEFGRQVLTSTMEYLSQIAIAKGATFVLEGAAMMATAATRAQGIGMATAGGALVALGLGGMAGAAGVAAKFGGGSSSPPLLLPPNNDDPPDSLDLGARVENVTTTEVHYHFEGPVFANPDEAAKQVAKMNKRGVMLGAA